MPKITVRFERWELEKVLTDLELWRTFRSESGVKDQPADDVVALVRAHLDRAFCIHCDLDLRRTSDGYCRACDQYRRKHGGELPPHALLRDRTRRLYEQSQ
jgi:hypothetical protein